VIVGEAKKDIRISRKPCAGQRAFGISPLRHGGLDPHIGNRKYRDNAMDESCIPHKTTVTSIARENMPFHKKRDCLSIDFLQD